MYRSPFKYKKILTRNETLARLPFIMAVIVGGGILSIMKYYNVHQMTVSLVAIVFIILYAISVTIVPALRLREDQLGDNCYYLGFLYTLGSLVWALRAFSLSNNVDDIIANFGLALFSTIIGIMLRVVINQSRKDILETERECRIELASAVARMRSTIDEATSSLDSFCQIIQQQTRESTAKTVEETSKAISTCTNNMLALNEKIINRIDRSLENHEKQAQKINIAVCVIEKEMQAVSERLKHIEVDRNLINIKMEPVITHIESSFNSLTGTIKEHSNNMMVLSEIIMNGINNSLSNHEKQAQKISGAVTVVENELLAISDKLKYMEVDKNLVNESLQHLVAPIGRHFNDLTSAVKDHNDFLINEIKRSKNITAELANSLTDLAEYIAEKVQ